MQITDYHIKTSQSLYREYFTCTHNYLDQGLIRLNQYIPVCVVAFFWTSGTNQRILDNALDSLLCSGRSLSQFV